MRPARQFSPLLSFATGAAVPVQLVTLASSSAAAAASGSRRAASACPAGSAWRYARVRARRGARACRFVFPAVGRPPPPW